MQLSQATSCSRLVIVNRILDTRKINPPGFSKEIGIKHSSIPTISRLCLWRPLIKDERLEASKQNLLILIHCSSKRGYRDTGGRTDTIQGICWQTTVHEGNKGSESIPPILFSNQSFSKLKWCSQKTQSLAVYGESTGNHSSVLQLPAQLSCIRNGRLPASWTQCSLTPENQMGMGQSLRIEGRAPEARNENRICQAITPLPVWEQNSILPVSLWPAN